MNIEKIIILDKKEFSEIEMDFISNATNAISYIESNHAYFFYLEDLDKEADDKDLPKEINDMMARLYTIATDNQMTYDIRILLTL